MGGELHGAESTQGFPRSQGVTGGVGGAEGIGPEAGKEQPGAAAGFEQAMKGAEAQAAQQPAGVEASSPMGIMEKHVEAPTTEKLQAQVEKTNSNFNTVLERVQTQGIQTTDQLPGGRGVQLLGERRLGQMHEGVGELSKVVGQNYTPPAKSSPLLSQLQTAQTQFQQIGNTMAKMGESGGFNITDMMRAQSQMQKIEQTVGFFSAATGELISGMKQLFTQQI